MDIDTNSAITNELIVMSDYEKQSRNKIQHDNDQTESKAEQPVANNVVTTIQSPSVCDNNNVDLTQIFPGSNLPEMTGYRGFQIHQSWEQIIKMRQKKRRYKKR